MQPAITLPAAALDKEHALLDWFRAQGSVVIGFSGGVDSTYLAACALDALGADHVLAVIGRSASLARSQWGSARAVAERIGVPVAELDTDELADPRYVANPSNRCYFCKSELWGKLVPFARARGFAVVVDGTNASDLGGHRPGMAAAREHDVASPLADVGLTKPEIRSLSRERGLPTWDQPAAPCLASRLPYGTEVTPDRLRQVDDAEEALRALGVTGDLRVRHHGDLARIELPPADVAHWLAAESLARLTSAVRSTGFARVAVDARGFRSGGMLVLLGNRESGIGNRGRAFEVRDLGVGMPRADAAARAHALGIAFGALGIVGAIERQGQVAVLATASPARLQDTGLRQAALATAAEHGFTTLAIELSARANAESES